MGLDIGRDERGRDPWIDRLSEYVDGDLAGAERTAFEAHLATCDTCAEALDDLRAVVSRAHALEDAPPAEDLWPGIERQIAPRRAHEPLTSDGRIWWGRRFELGVPQLAAAGVLLIALSAGAAWLAMRGPALQRPVVGARPGPGMIAAVPRSPDAAPENRGATGESPTVVPASDAGGRPEAVPAVVTNPGYDASIAGLEQALAEGRGQLDPKTLRTIERNLRVIDRALAEAREAVAADPNNTWLQSHLAATMKRKADLLRTATLLAVSG